MSLADFAAQRGLKRVGARPPLNAYLVEVWHRRQFIYSLSKFRIEAENQRNRLGIGWVVLKPMLNAVVYGVVFGILQGDSKPENFVQFLIIGVFMYEFFSTSLAAGTKSITGNYALVQSLSFPRMVLPLSAITQRLLQFIPSVVIMLLLNMAMGEVPRFQWLLLLPLIALYYLFNVGVGLITARLTVHFRDLSQLIPFITRLFFYTSGIFFSIEKIFGSYPRIMRFFDFQPLHEFMSLARGILISTDEYKVDPMYWAYAAVWSVSIFVIGLSFFWVAEERYGRTD